MVYERGEAWERVRGHRGHRRHDTGCRRRNDDRVPQEEPLTDMIERVEEPPTSPVVAVPEGIPLRDAFQRVSESPEGRVRNG